MKTKTKFKNEENYQQDDLLIPMNQVITDMPQNKLAAGSGIALGQTEEQKFEQQKAVLELRRIQNLNFQIEMRNKDYKDNKHLEEAEKMITNEDKMIEEAISKPLTANEKLRQLQSTEKYIEKYEQVLKEREEEELWQKTRHKRFQNMKNLMENLKGNLITAAYPRGGGEHLTKDVLGVAKESIGDSRALDKYKSFKSL